MRFVLAASLIAPLAFLACSNDAPRIAPDSPAAASAAPPVAPPVAPPAAALRLGEPISAPPATLADLATRPADFTGKSFVTSGQVTSVCQEMGCWMEIKDDQGQAHIRMHGHSFFVPKTAPGHHARVQGTLVPSTAASECEDESPAKDSAHPARSAKIELDATGIEID